MLDGNPYASPPQVAPLEASVIDLMRKHPTLTAAGYSPTRSSPSFINDRKRLYDADFARQIIDVAFCLLRQPLTLELPRDTAAANFQREVGREITPGAVIVAAHLAGFETELGEG